MQSVLRQMHHAEVEGGLHQTGEVRAHLLHALRQRKERVEHHGGSLRADGGSHLGLGTFERHARVAADVLIFERRVKAADELLKVRLLPRGDGDDRVAARADHVVEPAALYCREAQAGELLHRGVEHAAHQYVCAAAALVNVAAGVAALQAGDRHSVAALAAERLALAGKRAIRAHTACAGHREDALLLGVKIQELSALEVGAVERKRAVHADLLIDGENRLKRRMGERIVGKDGEDHRHGDAVVAAERGLIRPDPLAVRAQVKPLPRHVLRALVRLGADHVDVTL